MSTSPQTLHHLDRIATALERLAVAVEDYAFRDPLKLMEEVLAAGDGGALTGDYRNKNGTTWTPGQGDADLTDIPESERWRFD